MKKKNLGLKKKLALSKETIANLTPAQQAKLAGGYAITNTNCSINCDTSGITECASHYPCVNTKDNCQTAPSALCVPQ